MVSVVHINKAIGYALLDNDTITSFDTLLDENGDVTDNTDDAVFVLVMLPDDTYEIVKLSEFEPRWFN